MQPWFAVEDNPAAPVPPIAAHSDRWQPALDDAIVATAERESLLQRLNAPGALVVTTGQQPGLFTGPLYTIHKAFAAASLARRLEALWDRPVVPLFWIAGDDHDHLEASSASWLDAEGRLAGWSLPARPDSEPQLSMAREFLPRAIDVGLAHLQATLPAGVHADATMAWLRRHYRPGITVHSAAAGALAELLGPLGVACLDPTHPAFKAAQRPVLQRALQQAGRLDAMLAALPEPGTGISAGEGATLVFLETAKGRDRLVTEGAAFRTRRSGDRFTTGDLTALLEAEPERFSANVLLRPVVERALLPTVGYVAGPAEHRYLTTQVAALYPAFGLVPQVPVSRWGGTLVEPWVERLLDRLGLPANAVLNDDGSLARAVLQRDLPTKVVENLAQLRDTIATSGAVLAGAGQAIDPVLPRAVAGRSRKLAAVADDLERLFERHLRKRSDIAYAQFRRVAGAIRPGGAPQERRLTAATFLARYGQDWLDLIAAATDRWAARWTQ